MSWSNILLKEIPPSVYEEALRDSGISATRKKELQTKLNKLIEDKFIGNLNLFPKQNPFIRYKIAEELPGVITSILESYESLGKPGTKRERIPAVDKKTQKQKKDKYGRLMWETQGFGQYKFKETKTKPIPVAKRFDLILAQLEYAIEAVLGRLGISFQPSMSVAEVNKLTIDVGLTDEGVADAESKLERLLQSSIDLSGKMPKKPETGQLSEGDEDVPRKEPVLPGIKNDIDLLNFYKKLERNFEGSVTVRKKDGMVIETQISARAVDTFESDIQLEIAGLQDAAGIDLGEDKNKPKVAQPPLDSISQRFKRLNTSEKTKLSCVDYFFTKLAKHKKEGKDVDAKYREIIEDLGVSMYNILVAIYEIEYDDTPVLNFPALLGSKKIIPVKRVMPTFTFILGGKEYDFSSESAKEIQQLYAEGLKNNLTFAETRENLTRPEREKRNEELMISAEKKIIFEEVLQEIKEHQELQLEYIRAKGKADAQDVASGQKELKNISESLSNIAGAGINIGEVKTVVDGIEKPVDRTQELNELYNKTKEELNIKIIPAFGPEEQELGERIRGTPLPTSARRIDATAKVDPKYLSEEEYKETEKKLKDSQRAKKKLGAIERVKSRGKRIKLTPEEIGELEDMVLSSEEETNLKNKLQSHRQALVIFDPISGKKREKPSQRLIHGKGPKEGQPYTDEEMEAVNDSYLRNRLDPMRSSRESVEVERKKNRRENKKKYGISETDGERKKRLQKVRMDKIKEMQEEEDLTLQEAVAEYNKRYDLDVDTQSYVEVEESSEETKKALDSLLVELGVTSDTIVKEDTGMILNELNKKDRRLVKTLLQLAHPTEYFNEDVLKLGELITVLKSLGVVNENKGLKKRILKYEDENLMVVKRAVKLRREYEKLYKSIREVIYPKTGDDNE